MNNILVGSWSEGVGASREVIGKRRRGWRGALLSGKQPHSPYRLILHSPPPLSRLPQQGITTIPFHLPTLLLYVAHLKLSHRCLVSGFFTQPLLTGHTLANVQPPCYHHAINMHPPPPSIPTHHCFIQHTQNWPSDKHSVLGFWPKLHPPALH